MSQESSSNPLPSKEAPETPFVFNPLTKRIDLTRNELSALIDLSVQVKEKIRIRRKAQEPSGK